MYTGRLVFGSLISALILFTITSSDIHAVTDPFDSKEKKAASSPTFDLSDKFGTRGTDEGQFISPTSIDIDNKEKTLYITDLDNNRVQKFSLDGEFITEWGSLGTSEGQFNDPGDIAVDSTEGVVYVTDINNNRIQKFDVEGKFLGKWGTTGTAQGQFDHPGDISLDQTGHFVYVTDIDNARVQKFDSNGSFITEWGSFGQGDGEFNSPAGLTVSPSGETIYVSDTNNNRIQMFDQKGNFLGKWGNLGDNTGQFDRPDGITTDPEGQIVNVADRQNKRIQMFDSQGNYLTQLASLGSLAGQFGKPRDVAVDLLNRIYVVDKDNNNIQAFTPEKNSQVSDQEVDECLNILDNLDEHTASVKVASGVVTFQNGTTMTCQDLKKFWNDELEFRQYVKDYDAKAAANEFTSDNQLTNESIINFQDSGRVNKKGDNNIDNNDPICTFNSNDTTLPLC